MKEQTEQRYGSHVMLGTLVVIALLVFGFSVGLMVAPQDSNTDERDSVQKMPNIIVINNTVVSNNTAMLAEISELKSILDEDDIWKAEAIKLAEDEWNTERHLYEALIDLNVTDIDDKSDINNVIIRETDTSGEDVEDRDADVEQEVRVYYENSNGDDKRVTLIIETEIIDGDVEDVTYDLA